MRKDKLLQRKRRWISKMLSQYLVGFLSLVIDRSEDSMKNCSLFAESLDYRKKNLDSKNY